MILPDVASLLADESGEVRQLEIVSHVESSLFLNPLTRMCTIPQLAIIKGRDNKTLDFIPRMSVSRSKYMMFLSDVMHRVRHNDIIISIPAV